MNKRIGKSVPRVMFALGAVVLVALALTACGSDDDGGDTGSTGAETSAEGSPQDVSFTVSTWGAAPIMQLAAQELGAFDDLTVKGTDIFGGSEGLPLISSGDMQGLTELGETPVAIAAAQGVPLKIVWMTNDIPLKFVVDPSITDAEDLKGKKIGDPSGTVMQIAVFEYLTENGLSPDDIELVDLGGPELVSAFRSGAIDGTYMFPPFSTEIEKLGANTLEEIGGSQVVVFSSSFIEEHPEAVQAWVCGMAGVQEPAAKDATAAWKALSGVTEVPVGELEEQLPQDSIVKADEMLGPEYLGTDGAYAQKVASTSEYLVELDQIESEVTVAQANELVDPQFIEAVVAGECS